MTDSYFITLFAGISAAIGGGGGGTMGGADGVRAGSNSYHIGNGGSSSGGGGTPWAGGDSILGLAHPALFLMLPVLLHPADAHRSAEGRWAPEHGPSGAFTRTRSALDKGSEPSCGLARTGMPRSRRGEPGKDAAGGDLRSCLTAGRPKVVLCCEY